MGAVWLRFRAELRQRVLAFVALGLVAGLGGGVVLAAAAGARRTSSALRRVNHYEKSADVLANPDTGSLDGWTKFGRLPNVEASVLIKGAAVLGMVHGHLDLQYTGFELLAPTSDALFHTIDREKIVAGRRANPAAPDEVMVNPQLARRGFTVGHEFTLRVFTQPEANHLMATGQGAGRPVRLRVAGVVLPLDEVARAADDPRRAPIMLLTPGFLRTTHAGYFYGGLYVRFRHGAADVPAWERAVSAKVPGDVNYQERASTDARIERAVGPYIFALWAFAVLAAVVGGVIVLQTIGRQHAADARDHETLIGLGFVRRDLALLGFMRGLAIGAMGVVVAFVVAYAASSMMPVGPLRTVDPVAGRQIDATVFVIGAALLLVSLALHGFLSYSIAPTRRRTRAPRDLAVPVPPAVATGVRFAFDRGRGRTILPLRSTLIGATVAIAALIASLVYANALSRFTSTPRLYGWLWSYQVEGDNLKISDVQHRLAAVPGITYTTGAYGQLDFGKKSVPVVAVAPKRGMQTVDIVKGIAPRASDEVALGLNTMRSLHVGVGDTVYVRGMHGAVPEHVVGQAVFARFAPYPASDATGLGTGAALTLDGLKRVDRTKSEQGEIGSGSQFALVNVDPGAPVEAATLRRAVFGNHDPNGLVLGAQRPNDVLSYQHLRRTPLALALLLVLLGVATTVHLLVTGVRMRRRDLGLLKAIGCTIRQVVVVVLVQATVLIAVALAIAAPVGIIVGRLAWLFTAHWLGIPDRPVVPIGGVVAVILAVLVAVNLVALWPGFRAGRVRPALALRTE